jgi:ATP-dependent exoDNAse (exonuclease V) beta subunit
MNQRLQDALMTRYTLTVNQHYLRWVEEQSQMNVSTIHSFAYYMLKEYGIGESFTKNLSIRSFQYERRELIKDVIDGMIDENHRVLD